MLTMQCTNKNIANVAVLGTGRGRTIPLTVNKN